jgi:hypothetical protein
MYVYMYICMYVCGFGVCEVVGGITLLSELA